MSIISTIPNYGGKQPNNTSYIKQFVSGIGNSIISWIFVNNGQTPKTITPSVASANVLLQNNLYVNGAIYGTIATPSDVTLKENISDLEYLDNSITEKLMKIKPKKYFYKLKPNEIRYGFIAQELEEIFPELISELYTEKTNSTKAIKYNDFIPLLLLKIQQMQEEINELRSEFQNVKKQT